MEHTIGLVYFAPEEGADMCMKSLFDSLKEQGIEERVNLEVRRAHAQGEIGNIPLLIQNYDGSDVDLIVAMTTPVLTAAASMARSKPVVFTYVYDPSAERRYSPPVCLGTLTEISTSYIERQNLTMRMSMRRFTRLTNGFSKKLENHAAAVALHYMHYNFCRVHRTLRVTPAMEAGLANHVWGIDEIIGLLEAAELEPAA
jgi:hypothetical protein